MADARIEHVIFSSEETFWKIFFDPEFNQKLFMEVLQFDAWKVASQDETATGIERVVEAVPKTPDLPGPLKKLVEGGISYRERASFDRAKKRMTVAVETGVLPGKLSVTGVIHTEPVGDGKCKRIYDSTVVAKVFGVGGMIESRILADVKASYDKAAEFTNQWIKEKGLK
jgi:hypothetical protein